MVPFFFCPQRRILVFLRPQRTNELIEHITFQLSSSSSCLTGMSIHHGVLAARCCDHHCCCFVGLTTWLWPSKSVVLLLTRLPLNECEMNFSFIHSYLLGPCQKGNEREEFLGFPFVSSALVNKVSTKSMNSFVFVRSDPGIGIVRLVRLLVFDIMVH